MNIGQIFNLETACEGANSSSDEDVTELYIKFFKRYNAFIDRVTSTFGERSVEVLTFKALFQRNADKTIELREIVELFQGHKELLIGFNYFLPEGREIFVTEDRSAGEIIVSIKDLDGGVEHLRPAPIAPEVTAPGKKASIAVRKPWVWDFNCCREAFPWIGRD